MFLKQTPVYYLLFLGQKVKLPHYTGKHQVSPSLCMDVCRTPFRGLAWRSVGTAFSSSSTVLKKHIWHAHGQWHEISSLPIMKQESFSSVCCCCLVAKLRPTLCDPMDCSTPGLSVPHHLPRFAQVHLHCIGDTIQPSHLSEKKVCYFW